MFFFSSSGLLGNSCRYFSLLPVSQKMCSHWRPGSLPPRVLNALTFSHSAFARLLTEVHLRQQSSLHHQLTQNWCQGWLERLSTQFRSLYQHEKFYYVHQVHRKKNTSEISRYQKCHYLIAPLLKAKTSQPFMQPVIWLRTNTNKNVNIKVLTDVCQQFYFTFLVLLRTVFFNQQPNASPGPGYGPFY